MAGLKVFGLTCSTGAAATATSAACSAACAWLRASAAYCSAALRRSSSARIRASYSCCNASICRRIPARSSAGDTAGSASSHTLTANRDSFFMITTSNPPGDSNVIAGREYYEYKGIVWLFVITGAGRGSDSGSALRGPAAQKPGQGGVHGLAAATDRNSDTPMHDHESAMTGRYCKCRHRHGRQHHTHVPAAPAGRAAGRQPVTESAG